MPSRDSQATETPTSSPTPATDNPQASPQPATSSPIDGWVEGMIQIMNGMSTNLELRSRLRKRSF